MPVNRRVLEQLRRSRTKVTSARCGGLIPVSAIEGQRPGHMPAQGNALGLRHQTIEP